eukprot:661923-Prymnesium_polylepis.2
MPCSASGATCARSNRRLSSKPPPYVSTSRCRFSALASRARLRVSVRTVAVSDRTGSHILLVPPQRRKTCKRSNELLLVPRDAVPLHFQHIVRAGRPHEGVGEARHAERPQADEIILP